MFFNIVDKFVSIIFFLYLTLYFYEFIVTIYPNESIKFPSICWNNVILK